GVGGVAGVDGVTKGGVWVQDAGRVPTRGALRNRRRWWLQGHRINQEGLPVSETTTITTRPPPPFTRRPTTQTTTTPRNPFLVPEVKIVNNAIVVEKEENKPEPLYTFGYTTPTHGHTESMLPDGTKKGEYFWDSPEGWRFIVTYEANERGFYPRVKRVRTPTTTPKPEVQPEKEGEGPDREGQGKGLVDLPQPAGGCPYFFYYNTRINYHWERCFENHTKVGEYGLLGPDQYQHKNSYHADNTGYHPRQSRTLLTPEQQQTVAEYREGAFIVPKPDEERRATEKRILAWLAENRQKIDQPLR
ncbi:hypothetical protein Pcinc_033944, partial [Petrolisthes cinctipes]